MSAFTPVNPPELGEPRGFTHGLLAPAGWRLLFVAGQTGAGAGGQVADGGFVTQFVAALDKTLTVVRAAGGRPEHIGRMTVYVTDLDGYLESRSALGQKWRERMGDHYPAMALVGVTRLVDPHATVEIEATATIPPIDL
jgi:enamine deaminase RidA (YjgF/YER057c/UK114 family)